MADQWYYTENRERRGPVAEEQLKSLAASGQLKPNDPVWKQGMATWVSASTVEGLFPPGAEEERLADLAQPSSPAVPPPSASSHSAARDVATKAKAMAMSLVLCGKAAAQLVAKQAECAKLANITLPNLYQGLGRHVHGTGSYRNEFPEAHQKIDGLLTDIEAVRNGSTGAPKAEGFAAKAKAAAKATKAMSSVQALKVKLNHAMGSLGRTVFEKHGQRSGPAEITQPITACLARIAALDAEIAHLSQAQSGQWITPKRTAIAGMACLTLAIIAAVVIPMTRRSNHRNRVEKALGNATVETNGTRGEEPGHVQDFLRITSMQLSALYASDAAAADALYRDKTIEVIGSLSLSGAMPGEKGEHWSYIALKSLEDAEVNCIFRCPGDGLPPEYVKCLDKWDSGQGPPLVIRGRCQGMQVPGQVWIVDCKDTSSGVPRADSAARPDPPTRNAPDDSSTPSARDNGTTANGALAGQALIQEDSESQLPQDDIAEPVTAVAFSRDALRAATGGNNGSIYIWDVQTRKLLARIAAHQGRVNGVAILGKGDEVLSVGADKTVLLYDMDKKRDIQRWTTAHTAPILALAVGHTSRCAITGGEDNRLCFWDFSQRHLVRAISQSDRVLSVAISDDGATALSGNRDGLVHIWNTTDGTEMGRFEQHKSSVRAVALSPDGRMAVSAAQKEPCAILWDTGSRKVIREYERSEPITDLAFSADGTHFLSRTGRDAILFHVDYMPPVTSYHIVAAEQDHPSPIVFSPNSHLALVAGREGSAMMLPLPSLTGRGEFPVGELARFPCDGQGVVSDDGRQAMTVTEHKVTLWDVKRSQSLRSSGAECPILSSSLKCVADRRKGAKILLHDSQVTHALELALEEMASPQQKRMCEIGQLRWSPVFGIFSADTRYLAVAADEPHKNADDEFLTRCLLLVDARLGKELRRYADASFGWFLPDNKHMLIFGGVLGYDLKNKEYERAGARLVRVEDGQSVRTFAPFRGPFSEGENVPAKTNSYLNSIISDDGHRLVGESSDGSVRVWNIDSGELLCEFKGIHKAISHDGSRLCNGVEVRDVQTGRIIRRLIRQGGDPLRVCGVAFSPDGFHVAIASSSSLELWDVAQEKLVAELSPRSGSIGDSPYLVKFLPSGQTAYTVSEKNLIIWKLPKLGK